MVKRDIVKIIHESLLAKDTGTKKSEVVRMSQLGVKCGSGGNGIMKGRIRCVCMQ